MAITTWGILLGWGVTSYRGPPGPSVGPPLRIRRATREVFVVQRVRCCLACYCSSCSWVHGIYYVYWFGRAASLARPLRPAWLTDSRVGIRSSCGAGQWRRLVSIADITDFGPIARIVFPTAFSNYLHVWAGSLSAVSNGSSAGLASL